jgi:hypothetical protein
MLINVYGDEEIPLWSAADVIGANLFFRGGDEYRVTVHMAGYEVGETREHRDSRGWLDWLRSL